MSSSDAYSNSKSTVYQPEGLSKESVALLSITLLVAHIGSERFAGQLVNENRMTDLVEMLAAQQRRIEERMV